MSNSQNDNTSFSSEGDISDIFSILNNLSEETQETKETLLLNSLKPYLNKKRQKKLSQCEKLISLTDTLKTLNELHVFDDLFKTTDE